MHVLLCWPGRWNWELGGWGSPRKPPQGRKVDGAEAGPAQDPDTPRWPFLFLHLKGSSSGLQEAGAAAVVGCSLGVQRASLGVHHLPSPTRFPPGLLEPKLGCPPPPFCTLAGVNHFLCAGAAGKTGQDRGLLLHFPPIPGPATSGWTMQGA